MALTFSNFVRVPPFKGGTLMGFVDITFDSTADSGYVIQASDLGLRRLHNIMPPPVIVTTGDGYVPVWDQTDSTLKIYESGADAGGLDALSSASALNNLTIRCLYMGS